MIPVFILAWPVFSDLPQTLLRFAADAFTICRGRLPVPYSRKGNSFSVLNPKKCVNKYLQGYFVLL
jgi:hypothetical protein